MLRPLGFKVGADGLLTWLFHTYLRLKQGIIKDAVCFHAAGPYYSKQFGYLQRDIEKYKNSKLDRMVKVYSAFINK